MNSFTKVISGLSLAAALLLTSVTAQAQSLVGIKAGANFSTFAVDKDQINKANFRTGFTGGFYEQVPMGGDLFTFQPELLFTQKGTTYEVGTGDVEAKLSYLEVPLSIQFKIPVLPLKVYAGATASYLLAAKYDYDSDFFDDGRDAFEYKDKDGFNTLDLAAQLGVGAQFGAFLVDARFSRGFRNIEDDRVINSSAVLARDTKNFGIALTAGFAF